MSILDIQSQQAIFEDHGFFRSYFPLRDPEDVAAGEDAGRFVWHELYTPDAGRAIEFYTALFGWHSGPPEAHELARLRHQSGPDLAGVVELTPGQVMVSQWVPAVSVLHAAEAARMAERHGATVMVRDDHIDKAHRLDLLRDPQGALLSALEGQKRTAPAADLTPGPIGGFSWHELYTPQPEASQRFYRDLLPWDPTTRRIGSIRRYRLLGTRDRPAAGLVTIGNPKAAAHWLSYIQVADAEQTALKAEKLGGRVLHKPERLEDEVHYAILADPQNAPFGVVEPHHLPR